MSKWCIGIDIGGTFVKLGLLDEHRKPSGLFQLPTPPEGGGENLVRLMASGVDQLLSQHKIDRRDVLGIGIGCPGPLDTTNGLILALPNIPGMDNLPVRDMLTSATGLPCILENDANAAGYGEFIAGAGQGTRDMVLLTLGTGIGSGIIIGGKLLRGSHDTGGEVGHMIVQPGGELCGCSQHGCLERYSSATYLARHAQTLLEQGCQSSLSPVLKATGTITSKDVLAAAKAGDKLAMEVWDRAIYYLAIGCIGICQMLDPDEIVIGGGLSKAGDDLMVPLRRKVESMYWKLTPLRTKLVLATLGNDAGVIGAAGVAWEAFAGGTRDSKSAQQGLRD